MGLLICIHAQNSKPTNLVTFLDLGKFINSYNNVTNFAIP